MVGEGLFCTLISSICSNSFLFYICNDYPFPVNVGRTSRQDQERRHCRISNTPLRVGILKYKNMNPTTVDWSEVSKVVDVILIVPNYDKFFAEYKIFSDPKRGDTGVNLGRVYFDNVGSNIEVLLKSSMGSIGGTGMRATCLEGTKALNPRAIVCLGVCFGLNQKPNCVHPIWFLCINSSYQQRWAKHSGNNTRAGYTIN